MRGVFTGVGGPCMIQVGRFPTHAALSADGRALLVTSHYGYTVDVVDLQRRRSVGGKWVRSIPVGFEPYGVMVCCEGDELYVANSLSDTVSIVDVESGRTRFEVPVGRNPRFVAEIPGAGQIIVACGLRSSTLGRSVHHGRRGCGGRRSWRSRRRISRRTVSPRQPRRVIPPPHLRRVSESSPAGAGPMAHRTRARTSRRWKTRTPTRRHNPAASTRTT